MSSKEEVENSDQSHNPESTTDHLVIDELAASDPSSEKQHNDKDETFSRVVDFRAFRTIVDFETFRKDDKSGWPEIVKNHYLGHNNGRMGYLASRQLIEGRHRFVALKWPRNPNGEFMTLQHPTAGKVTSNGRSCFCFNLRFA